MPDHFALLNEPRRPWLDPEVLKEKFFALSASIHPDRVHNLSEAERAAAQACYIELNAAYSCLKNPRDRLRHLLELELGSVPKDIQSIPSELMDLSLQIGQACREADVLILEKSRITSPLLKVQSFERAQKQTEKLQSLQRIISGKREVFISELKEIDSQWSSSSPDSVRRKGMLENIERVYRLLSYFERWLAQIQERVVQLAF